jgi:hypothetical protein
LTHRGLLFIMLKGDIKINLKGLKRFRKVIDDDLKNGGTGVIRKCIKQWEYRYRAEMQKRFLLNSKGGGDWPPLALSTVLNRRKGKSKTKQIRQAMILRDTGTLFNVLSPAFKSDPGAFRKETKYGVTVGYGGPGKYPGGTATIADIASFHQVGAGYLPVRAIIVEPSTSLRSQMVSDMQAAMKKLSDDTIEGSA